MNEAYRRPLRSYQIAVEILCPILFCVSPARGQYHTYSEIGPELLAAKQNYPDICKRYDLGLSVQGRHIWALQISDNVEVEEDEPEFRYISTMHGNEALGVEMCLNLISYLTTNYGSIQRVTDIVDSVELWVVPLMNPDGHVADSRYNAHGVDLNRDFPCPYTSPDNTTAGREAETGVIMNWCFERSFTLAANFHCGAVVACYPFDANITGADVDTPTPDDDLFRWISEEYSQHNPPMWNSSTFFHGISNGADWYVIYGGMQDWSYRYMGTNEITIELAYSDPAPSQIPTYWDNNRESMLAFIETCLIGVRGIVTDGSTGEPLAATITVVGREHEVYTDPDVGDYHRMLLPPGYPQDSYDLIFESPGYDRRPVMGVSVTSGEATRLDVALGLPADVTSPNGGEMLMAGSPTLITWTGDPAVQFHVQYTADASDIESEFDGFETGNLDEGYDTGGSNVWSVTSGQSHQGSYAARSGAISHGQTTWMTRSVDGGNLSFWYRVSSETGYDFFIFYVDGEPEIQDSGTTGGWEYYSTTLPLGSHLLKWQYSKDEYVSSGYDTVWVDDLTLSVNNVVWTDVVGATPVGATSTLWTPFHGGTDYKVRVRSYYGDGAYGLWDESDSVFTILSGPIPAVSDWGLVVMLLAVMTAGTIVLRRRRPRMAATCVPTSEYADSRSGDPS